MHDYQAEIISENLLMSRRLGESRELREFSQEVIKSIKKAFIKVSQVKSLFDEADSRPEIKAELKRMLNEATGLNDDKTIEIDKKDITAISNMVYDRFKENLVGVYSFLSSQITHNYTAFNVIEYKQFDSSKPDAFALPYDRQQRILLAMLPKTLRHGGMTDTVIHEASHNAAATLDHTYIGNIRAESGSFPRSFQQSAREDSHFFADDRISKFSATYALGLPASAVLTPQQELTARDLIECSKLVKADTLLNAAEYITYIIDVLSRHHIQGSRIWPNEGTSRPKRNDDARNHRLELTIIEAVLGLSLH
ncbi:unnamed protein product [Nesidiocoris tenuis]|nr:unnamed protein product [Nesidiocoris tenuis]